MKKLIIAIVLLCTTVFADHENENENQNQGLYWRQLPVVCGEASVVDSYIELNDFEPVAVSLGRESSKPEGEPVFMVTFYANDRKESLAVVDVPSGVERCIMFHTFDTAIATKKHDT